MNALRRFDDRVLVAVNDLARHTGWLHTPMEVYARYGMALFAVLLALGLLVSRRRDSHQLAAAGWACIATVVSVAIGQPLNHLVSEARPYTTHPHLLVLGSRSADLSFPSDHAVMAGAVAAGLLLVNRRLGLVALAAAAVMAFARVYVGVHYPWDVVAGLALGAVVAIGGWLLLSRPLTRLTGWLRVRLGLRAIFAQPTDSSVRTKSHQLAFRP